MGKTILVVEEIGRGESADDAEEESVDHVAESTLSKKLKEQAVAHIKPKSNIWFNMKRDPENQDETSFATDKAAGSKDPREAR